MHSLLSPPQSLLADFSGQLLAVDERYFAMLRFWAPKISVVAVDGKGHTAGRSVFDRIVGRRGNPRDAIAVTGDREALEAFFGAPAPEPTILHVDSKRIGVLDVTGFLAKSDAPGRAGLLSLRVQMRELSDDDQADAVLLRIDSPGGTVAGTPDLAAAIEEVRETLPVYAFVEDMCAASAYWIAAAAERIYANTPTAMVGGIGMFVGLYDRSEQFTKAGVKALVIKAGEFKGAGWPGTAISEKQRAAWQKLVDQAQGEFNAAIRHRADPRKVANGKLYTAGDAERLKLIDGVKSFDDVLAELAAKAK